jgi:hypothetical protein
MNRRHLLKMAGLAAASAAGLESLAKSESQRSPNVRPDPKDIAKLAHDYTAAWNSKSPNSVASFFAEDGAIVINRANHGSAGSESPKWPLASLPMSRTCR